MTMLMGNVAAQPKRAVSLNRDKPTTTNFPTADATACEVPEVMLRIGDLTLWPEPYRVSVGGRTRLMTAVQFRLLCQLAAHPYRTFSADELYAGEPIFQNFDVKKAIRQRVYMIRRHLGPGARQLQTVRDEGYRLVE